MKGLRNLSLNKYKLVYYLHDYNTPQFDRTRPEVKVDISFIKAFVNKGAEEMDVLRIRNDTSVYVGTKSNVYLAYNIV